MTAPAIERINASLTQIDDWTTSEGVPGVGAVVWWQGEQVAERYAGDAQRDLAVDERTLFSLASVTKPVVAAGVVRLIEHGTIELDQPVVSLIPEFRPPPDRDENGFDRESVTIRQLLCHVSGLPEDLPRGTFRDQDLPNLKAMTDAMCRLPLAYEPGSELIYSNAGFALLGRVIERATGRDCWDVVWDEVLDPLELHDTVARPGPALDGRIARVADPAGEGTPSESFNGAWWRDLGLPWAGLYSSARDMARFAAAFMPGGPHFLDADLATEMVTDQARGVRGAVQSMRVVWPVASWGLGWEVKGTKRNHWTGDLTSPSTYCHFGATGTLLWADPEREIAVALFGNRTVRSLWPFKPARWARICNALIAAVDRDR